MIFWWGCDACQSEYDDLGNCLHGMQSCERRELMDAFWYPSCFETCASEAGTLYSCMETNSCTPDAYSDDDPFRYDSSWGWPLSCNSCTTQWVTMQACIWPEISNSELDTCSYLVTQKDERRIFGLILDRKVRGHHFKNSSSHAVFICSSCNNFRRDFWLTKQ